MTVEAASYVGQLNTALPDANDGKSEGDDHLRLIKATLLGTFPNLVGRIHRTQVKTGDYAYVADDNGTIIEFQVAAPTSFTGGATAAAVGNGWYVIMYANGDDVTINPSGSELINGATTLVVKDGTAVIIRCTGGAFTAFFLLPAVAATALALLKGAPITDPVFRGTVQLSKANIHPFWAAGATENDPDIPGAAYDVGYRDVPQNIQNNDYTFTLDDRGRHVIKTDASAGNQWVIPPNSTTAFPIGSAITLVHNSTTENVAIEQGAGVTLIQAGSGATGSRTLAPKGLVTILKVATDVWFIQGAGVS